MLRFKIRTLMIVVAVLAVVPKVAEKAWPWFQDKNNYAWPIAQINGLGVLALLVIAPVVGVFARNVRINDIPPDQPRPNDAPSGGGID